MHWQRKCPNINTSHLKEAPDRIIMVETGHTFQLSKASSMAPCAYRRRCRVRLRCTGFPSANSTTVIYVAHRVNHVYYECTCLTFSITTVRHVYSTDTNMFDFYHYYRSIDRSFVCSASTHQHIAKKKVNI